MHHAFAYLYFLSHDHWTHKLFNISQIISSCTDAICAIEVKCLAHTLLFVDAELHYQIYF